MRMFVPIQTICMVLGFSLCSFASSSSAQSVKMLELIQRSFDFDYIGITATNQNRKQVKPVRLLQVPC